MTKTIEKVTITKDDVILTPYGENAVQKMGRVSSAEEMPVGTEIEVKVLGIGVTKLLSKTSMAWYLGLKSGKGFDPYSLPNKRENWPDKGCFPDIDQGVQAIINSQMKHLNQVASAEKYGEERASKYNRRHEKERRKYLKKRKEDMRKYQKDMQIARDMFDWFYAPEDTEDEAEPEPETA